jgi:hypothetical protein
VESPDKDAGTITGEEKKKHSCNPHVYTEWHIWKERNRRVFEGKLEAWAGFLSNIR